MEYELSIVMPCLNEAETVAVCVKKAMEFLNKNEIVGEVIIGDNGSTDGSRTLAANAGAKVVNVEKKGYGNATRQAISYAKGKYIITADTDDSHDLLNLMPFIIKLREGYDLVMGNRFKGERIPAAMSVLHRYVGNPLLTGVGNVFFRTKVGDFHCGLRGFTKEAFNAMDLKTTGMEFASEIVVKASLNNLKIAEVATTVYPAGRSRRPHLRSFPDGWRHLRFLLLYSPKWLFLLPGLVVIILGLFFSLLIVFNDEMDVNWLPLSAFAVIIGFQFCLFYALTKIYAINHGIAPRPKNYGKIFKILNLELGLIVGLITSLIGFIGIAYTLFYSLASSFQLELVTCSSLFLVLGIQIILFSFFFSILGLGEKMQA